MSKKEDLAAADLLEMLGSMSEADKANLIQDHQKATNVLPNGMTEDQIFSTKHRGPSERCWMLYGNLLKQLMAVNSPVLFIPNEQLYAEYRVIQDSDDPYASVYNRNQLREWIRRFVSHNNIPWVERSERLARRLTVVGPYGHRDMNTMGWAHKSVGPTVPADKVYPSNWFYDRKTKTN